MRTLLRLICLAVTVLLLATPAAASVDPSTRHYAAVDLDGWRLEAFDTGWVCVDGADDAYGSWCDRAAVSFDDSTAHVQGALHVGEAFIQYDLALDASTGVPSATAYRQPMACVPAPAGSPGVAIERAAVPSGAFDVASADRTTAHPALLAGTIVESTSTNASVCVPQPRICSYRQIPPFWYFVVPVPCVPQP
jgi:hypothetical protein